MVRMAQEWSMRTLLVDGQGNFGSVDGDSQRNALYRSQRMQDFKEISRKETVDFQLNLMIRYMSQSNAKSSTLLIKELLVR
jgi:DNA gyrase subunit A